MTKTIRLEGGPGDGQTAELLQDFEWVQWEGPPRAKKVKKRNILHRPNPPPAFYRYRRDPARPNVYVYVGHSRHNTR